MFRRAFVLCALALVACGGDSSTSPASIVVTGTWRLKTYNGSAPPILLSQTSTTKTEVLDETITLNADGTFSDLVNARITQGATMTTTPVAVIGVYINTNGAIRFTPTTPAGQNAYNGTVNGNTMTIIGTATLVYQR